MSSPLSAKQTVIFLDIDGVLISHDTYPSNQKLAEKHAELFPGKTYKPYTSIHEPGRLALISHYFCPKALKNLHDLIARVNEKAQLSIVLSSNWRLEKDIQQAKEALKLHPFSAHIIDKTEERGFDRGEEIYNWLIDNDEIWEKYVIIDDSDDGISSVHPKKFVQIDPGQLLTPENCEKAYQILTKKR